MSDQLQGTVPSLGWRAIVRAPLLAAACVAMMLGAATTVRAQSLSLSGAVYIYQANARPVPAIGYKVYLYNKQSGWSRPSFTDGAGRYAHYGVGPGNYLLLVRNAQNAEVWRQDVTVTRGAPTQVKWIVLPRP